MKTTKLTPEQKDAKAFERFCTRCQQADLQIMKAEASLIKMKTKAIMAGIWLPKAKAQLLRSI
jgi:hypothetical protein